MGALLDAATPLAHDPAHRADIAYQRAHLDRIRGVLIHAYEVLMPVAAEVTRVDPRRAARMLAIAGLVAADTQDLPRLREAAVRAERLVPPDGAAPFDAQWVRGVCAVMSGDFAGAMPSIVDTAERARCGDHPGDLLLAGTAAMFVGDDHLCSELFAGGIRLARRLGTPAGLAVLLGPSAMVDMWSGRLAASAADATEGVRFAELVGAPNLATLGQAGRCRRRHRFHRGTRPARRGDPPVRARPHRAALRRAPAPSAPSRRRPAAPAHRVGDLRTSRSGPLDGPRPR